MSDRIANIIVLCEDQEQQNLVRRYLDCLRLKATRYCGLPGARGCGSQFVLHQFPVQVAVCRSTLGKKTRCLLVVLVDADSLSVEDRRQQLLQELVRSKSRALQTEEPIIVLIPKWQIETWIKCLLGEPMDENDKSSDHRAVSPSDIKKAASALYDWSRNGAQIGATCVPSLRTALPQWQRIG